MNVSSKWLTIYLIIKCMRALWLVNQLWFMVPVNFLKFHVPSELFYKSNRPQVFIAYRHHKPLGMLECGSWFTNSSRVLPTSRVVFLVFMWRNHFPKPKNINFCEVLVLSDVKTSKTLTFCNVWARQGSSLCSRVRLNFQVCTLRYIKMADC